jgi:hypothetical protein
MERRDAGLKIQIVGGCGQELPSAAHLLGPLRTRRNQPTPPPRRRAA